VSAIRALTSQDRWHAGRPGGKSRIVGLLIWLVFILVPVVDAITNDGPPTEHLLAIAGAALFSATYVWLVMIWFDELGGWRPFALLGVLLILAMALTLADRPSWGFMFTYVAACVGLVVPAGLGLRRSSAVAYSPSSAASSPGVEVAAESAMAPAPSEWDCCWCSCATCGCAARS
jgi:hypothetical protein